MTAGCCCPVLELRQYTLHPGTRETLIELFDREFVETQEAVGMQVVAQFARYCRAGRHTARRSDLRTRSNFGIGERI